VTPAACRLPVMAELDKIGVACRDREVLEVAFERPVLDKQLECAASDHRVRDQKYTEVFPSG
jgi:hypothetical protein